MASGSSQKLQSPVIEPIFKSCIFVFRFLLRSLQASLWPHRCLKIRQHQSIMRRKPKDASTLPNPPNCDNNFTNISPSFQTLDTTIDSEIHSQHTINPITNQDSVESESTNDSSPDTQLTNGKIATIYGSLDSHRQLNNDNADVPYHNSNDIELSTGNVYINTANTIDDVNLGDSVL